MQIEQKLLLVNQILLADKHFQILGKSYTQKPPTRLTLYKADLIYQDVIEEYKFLGLLSKSETKRTLIRLGLWSQQADEILQSTEKAIKDSCVELYRAAFDFKKQKEIRARLKSLRLKRDTMTEKLGYLDPYTLEFAAALQKTQFIVSQTVYDDETGKLINADDVSLLTGIINEMNNSVIPIETYKELAKTDPWRAVWSVDKANTFGKPVIDLTEEQRTLVMLSKFYDSIFEHPECPDDAVLNDEDMLEGWLILQQRDNEKEKKKRSADKILGLTDKMKDAASNEVMIVANSKEEAAEINSLNDVTGQMIIRERMAVIKQRGEAQDMDFRDVKLEALRQVNKGK